MAGVTGSSNRATAPPVNFKSESIRRVFKFGVRGFNVKFNLLISESYYCHCHWHTATGTALSFELELPVAAAAALQVQVVASDSASDSPDSDAERHGGVTVTVTVAPARRAPPGTPSRRSTRGGAVLLVVPVPLAVTTGDRTTFKLTADRVWVRRGEPDQLVPA